MPLNIVVHSRRNPRSFPPNETAVPHAPVDHEPDIRRLNNLDAIRLVAAVAVLVAHSWPLTGTRGVPMIAGIPLFTVAVFVFFSTSGFLITKSWDRLQSPGAYLRHRALRIFPALIVLVVVTTLIIGPAATTLPLSEYFSAPGTWSYLTNLTLVASYELPGVFAAHPRPVVNGCLWTLGPEFLCYLGVLGIGLLTRGARPATRRLLGIALTIVASLVVGFVFVTTPSGAPLAVTFAAIMFFIVGSVLARLRPTGIPLAVAPLALIVWISLGTMFPPLSIPLAWLAIPLTVISVGLRSTPVIRRAGRYGDFSYGLYLWGYLVQQVTLSLLPNVNVLTLTLIAVVATWAIAAVSWRVIERPSLEWARRPRPLKPRSSPVGSIST